MVAERNLVGAIRGAVIMSRAHLHGLGSALIVSAMESPFVSRLASAVAIAIATTIASKLVERFLSKKGK